jgi:AcrR family transcriptional regulator
VGRRRHYTDHDERALIFDSAYAILREHGVEGVTLGRILDRAGLSTRSFYRHFPAKDALLCAMYRRDAEWAGKRVSAALGEAASPTEAVEAWVGEIFRIVGDQHRAERAAVLGSLIATRADGMGVEDAHAKKVLVGPLVAVIEAGVAGGSFDAADAARAADLVAATVMHAAGLDPLRPAASVHDPTEVCGYVLRMLGAPSKAL